MKFPSEREKLALEVARYREASADRRLEALFDLVLLCESFLAASPNRDRQIRLLEENEEIEHRSWRELIAAHARRGTAASGAF